LFDFVQDSRAYLGANDREVNNDEIWMERRLQTK